VKFIAAVASTGRVGSWMRRKQVAIGIAIALGILAYGNGRMVYLAITSQPECVSHVKQNTNGAEPIAAKSSC